MKTKTIIFVAIVVIIFGGYLLTRNTSMAPTNDIVVDSANLTGPLKEFTMTAYYDSKGMWYSLKEMSVKKGDHVRVKLTNTAGIHDFLINEFGIKKELPLNEEVVVDFIADKVGSFVYYCSKPGHKTGGQWGTLVVTE